MKHKMPNYKRSTWKTLIQIYFFFFCFNSYGQLSTYSFSSATDSLIDMSSGTNVLLGPSSDDIFSSITNIGFTFIYDGTSYTQFSISSNGLMRLGSRYITIDSTNVLVASSNLPRIAPYWDNLHTGASGVVVYKLTGTSPNRKLCVEWFFTLPKNPNSLANAKIQVVLFETSNVIKFIYGNSSTFTGIPLNESKYTVGLTNSPSDYKSVTIANSAVSSSLPIDTNTVPIGYKKSFTFTPSSVATAIPTCITTKSPANGANLVSTNVILNWTGNLSATGSPSGYDVYFGTNSTPPIVSTNQTATNYNPGTLLGNTKYYWKINPRNAFGIANCLKDSFTTFSPINYNVIRTTNAPATSIASGNKVTSWRNSVNTDDNLSNAVPIGFNFTYQGIARTNVLISLNGFLTFNTSAAANGGGSGAYGPTNLNFSVDGTTGSTLCVAPFYEDLVCTGNNVTQASLDTSIRYLTTGTAGSRIFTVQWSDMEIYNAEGPDLTFQVRLFEGSNNIEFVYSKMDGFNGTNNHVYTYTAGLNASTISFPPGSQELITQQIANTRSYGNTPANSENIIPECYSKILFTPGNYTPYIPNVTQPNDNPAGALVLPFNPDLCANTCGIVYSSAGNTASTVPVCSGNADDDVWFKFTPTDTGSFIGGTIKVLCSGGYDAVVQMLDASFNSIVCKNSSFLGQIETISSVLTVGNEYYIRVYHAGTSSGTNGNFSICVSKTPLPPPNDECAGALNVPVNLNMTPINGSNTGPATQSIENGVQVCNGTIADDDVWYYFVTPGVTVTIDVQSLGTFNAAVQVFSGACGALTALQCANQTSTGGHEILTVNGLASFTTYFLRVYHATSGAAGGDFTIGISSPVPGCPTVFNPPTATTEIISTGEILSWNPVYNAQSYDVYLDIEKPVDSLLVADTAATSVFTGPLVFESGTTYYWTVVPKNYMGSATGCPINLFAPVQPDIILNLKMFIDGYYLGNQTMVAFQDPNFPPDLTDTIPDLTDSIYISLADSAPPNEILWSYKAALYSNGIAQAFFPGFFFGKHYHVVINHRNSIETWSKLFLFELSDTLYDMSVSIASGLKPTPTLRTGEYLPRTDVKEKSPPRINEVSIESLLPRYLLRNEDDQDHFYNVEDRLIRLLAY